jgi:hypothetical protein
MKDDLKLPDPDSVAFVEELGGLAVLDGERLASYLRLRAVLHVLAVSTARGVDDRVQAAGGGARR